MILEGIVTTINLDGTTNVAPMGPVVDRQVRSLRLRPFRTSRTFENLKRTEQGVFNITDDVELFARAAINEWHEPPPLLSCSIVDGRFLADACRWFAFRVSTMEESQERAELQCQIVDEQNIRPFFGFNRAKHAVIEAAILATRIRILPAKTIHDELTRLELPVRKTAGDQEQRAFELLRNYVIRESTSSGANPQ